MSVNTSRRLTLLRCPFMTFYKNTVQTGFADSVLAHGAVIELWHIPCERPHVVSGHTTTAKVEIKSGVDEHRMRICKQNLKTN